MLVKFEWKFSVEKVFIRLMPFILNVIHFDKINVYLNTVEPTENLS